MELKHDIIEGGRRMYEVNTRIKLGLYMAIANERDRYVAATTIILHT